MEVLKYDGVVDIATGLSAGSARWKNTKVKWSDLAKKLASSTRTNEKYAEYMAASKAEQSKIKDVGGFVGGYLNKGERSARSVRHRQVLTLDLDYATEGLWELVELMFDSAVVMHTTHSHHPTKPRYRIIMPLNRPAIGDEYLALGRKVAEVIGMELFDETSFQLNRLMFWPSNPRDVEYEFYQQDGPFLDVDEVLGQYVDWTDVSEWATLSRIESGLKVDKQEDPTLKGGMVGLFCRTYDIHKAIAEFLPDIYAETDHPDRYTYLGGSTAMGLVTYEDKFAYSHHGTDPVSGQLVNSFDLVRIHLFGELDKGGEKGARAPSYKAMVDKARSMPEVKKHIAAERISAAAEDFGDLEPADMEDDSWTEDLEIDKSGGYRSTAGNINLILANDPRLKARFRRNEFKSRNYVKGVPWRKVKDWETIRDVDYSGIRNYIEVAYGISGSAKIDDALSLELERNAYHPIRDYLKGLEWDGVPRVETLMVDYFGAPDTLYHREAIRCTLVGAVARVMRPGTKFDTMIVLYGPQGCGKSTFIGTLSANRQEWFSDSLYKMEGKDAMEQVQGAWLIEIAELSAFGKSEVTQIKHFTAKTSDTFRPAYGKTVETFQRQCIFWGTTNDRNFLKDPTGNRRYFPIGVRLGHRTKCFMDDLPGEVDQIWAEALTMYEDGASLVLSPEADREANEIRSSHTEVDERSGLIQAYLDTPLPDNWDTMSPQDRSLYLDGGLSGPKGENVRTEVCIAEIWSEALGNRKEDLDRYKSRDLNGVMRLLSDEWEETGATKTFPIYGKQRYYIRKEVKRGKKGKRKANRA